MLKRFLVLMTLSLSIFLVACTPAAETPEDTETVETSTTDVEVKVEVTDSETDEKNVEENEDQDEESDETNSSDELDNEGIISSEECITDDGKAGFSTTTGDNEKICVAVGDYIPNTQCRVNPYGACVQFGLFEGESCVTSGDNPRDGFVGSNPITGPYCVAIGDAIYDTDCVIGQDGACEAIQ
ncbi:hypothetical protein ACFL21_01550 [Patescibacteria group bacterium]